VIRELITAEKKRTGQGNGEYRLFEAIQQYIKKEISTQVGFNMHIYLTINIDGIIRMCLLMLTKRTVCGFDQLQYNCNHSLRILTMKTIQIVLTGVS